MIFDFKLVLDILIGVVIPLGGWLLLRKKPDSKTPSDTEILNSIIQENAKMKRQIDVLRREVFELQNYRRKITPQIVGLKARGRKKKRVVQNISDKK